MKEQDIFNHGWKDPNTELPDVDWSDPDEEGKKYFHPKTIILLRRLVFSYGIIYTLSIGEWDTTGVPPEWRTWDEHKDKDGDHNTGGKVVDDVIAWREAPLIPWNINFQTEFSRHNPEIKLDHN